MKRFTLCLASLFVLTSLSAYADDFTRTSDAPKKGTPVINENAPEYCKEPLKGGGHQGGCVEDPLMFIGQDANGQRAYRFGFADWSVEELKKWTDSTWNNWILDQDMDCTGSGSGLETEAKCRYVGAGLEYESGTQDQHWIKMLTCADTKCDPARAVMYVKKQNDGTFRSQGHCVWKPTASYCAPNQCKNPCEKCVPGIVWMSGTNKDKYVLREKNNDGSLHYDLERLDNVLKGLDWSKIGLEQSCVCAETGLVTPIYTDPEENPTTTPTETNVCLATIENLKVTYGRCWLYLSEFYLYEEDVPEKPNNWDSMSTTEKQEWCVNNAERVLKEKADYFMAEIKNWAKNAGVDCNAGSQRVSVVESVASGAVYVGRSGANYSYSNDKSSARAKISSFIKDVDNSKKSAWKTAEGKFNTARLASDLTAGVVLGTVGGVVSGVVIKKKQVEKGFDALHCTVGGQPIADWGDTFNVGLRRY